MASFWWCDLILCVILYLVTNVETNSSILGDVMPIFLKSEMAADAVFFLQENECWFSSRFLLQGVSGDCTELYVDSVIKLGLLFHVHHVILCFVWTNNLLGDWLTCLANDSPKNHQHKSQTVADDSGVDVAEEVVTNCSPTFVVVDFHTPLAWNGTSCQSDGCAK